MTHPELAGVELALHAIHGVGRIPRVVPMSWYREHKVEHEDYLVLTDELFELWENELRGDAPPTAEDP